MILNLKIKFSRDYDLHLVHLALFHQTCSYAINLKIKIFRVKTLVTQTQLIKHYNTR